ncbi:MAG: hypothetical protein ACI9ZX_001936, partial [Algoriphagus sp.]
GSLGQTAHVNPFTTSSTMKSDPFVERGKSPGKPAPSKVQKEDEPKGSMADKLAMLKGEFGG